LERIRRETLALADQAGLDKAELERLQRVQEARHAEGQARLARQRDLYSQVTYGLAGMLALVGILAPLSTIWSRVVINHDLRGNLSVFVWHILPRTYTYDLRDFGGIQYGAEEIVHRGKYQMVTDRYWRWYVRLMPAAPPGSGPGHPLDLTSISLSFHPFRQKDRPSATGRPPQPVTALIAWLRQQGNFPATGPLFFEESQERRGFLRGRRKQLAGYQPEVCVTTQRGTEDLTPEERTEALRHARKAVRPGDPWRRHTTDISYQDSSGQMHRARTLEELPEEIQARIREAKAQAGNAPRTFTFKDASGVEHTYHSLEEMPPELREVFLRQMEQFRGKRP